METKQANIMNAIQIAETLETSGEIYRDGVILAAKMLRKQDAAIRQLREALEAMVYEGHWSADEKAKAALAATEEFK